VSATDAAEHLEESLAEENGFASLTLIGRFNEGQELDEGMAEIVTFHKNSNSILVINAQSSMVDILDASDLESTELTNPLSSSNLEARTPVDVGSDVDGDESLSGFESGGINSVAVQGNLMAVAVEHDDKQTDGVVAFYTLDTSGEATYLHSVEAGALPDNVQISPDGAYVAVANEGEPSDDYQDDPEGTVTVISVTNGTPATTGTLVRFTAFNENQPRHSEVADVRISHPEASVAEDLEPEYIAMSDDSTKAFVSMQENNAVAVIDLASATIDSIFGLGYKDHSVAGNGLDPSNKDACDQGDIDEGDCSELNDGININTWNNLRGLYMPDSIVSFSMGGADYVVTANEGDSREYIYETDEETCNDAGHEFDDGECISWIDETRVKDLTLDPTVFSDDTVQDNENLGRLKAISTEGDTDGDQDIDIIYSFGTRSFSIFNASTGALVSDSGDAFEQITAQVLGTDGFNSTDDENDFDDRSDDKGPEPEALAVGAVDGKTYAFIGLERVGGIMMYDISTPSSPQFVQYTINRNFDVDIEEDLANAGDLAPEGMKFVAAADSPTGNALLIVGNEVSGTTTVYEVK
ncbi:MAG: choice-of-anchor I family protein, partial [Pseudomonadales bacterium]|nr:choice-of-anchor I family protein [Pseudomonadales bacterium]